MAMAILMLVGGMELEFKGRGCVMLLLTFMPMTFEATGVAIGARLLLKMDLEFCIALGFVIAAVSPGVLIPVVMKLK